MNARPCRYRWFRFIALSAAAGAVFQTGCALDPDILANAFFQILADTGIFVLQNALYSI